MSKTENKKWIQHYNNSQKILLVGEGDFSFSACLARAFGNAANMVATCQHSQVVLTSKHWTSEEHIRNLESQGCLVLYEVDVFIMNHHPDLRDGKFDRIVFNFPHAGHFAWLRERDIALILKHQDLLKGYFKSAKDMLEQEGEVHVTTRTDEPYNQWEIEKLALNEGLILKEKVEFYQSDYPGYHNKRGGSSKSNQKFPLSHKKWPYHSSYTFKFISNKCEAVPDDVHVERDVDSSMLNHNVSIEANTDVADDAHEGSDDAAGESKWRIFFIFEFLVRNAFGCCIKTDDDITKPARS